MTLLDRSTITGGGKPPEAYEGTTANAQASETVLAPFQNFKSVVDPGPSEGGELSSEIVQESIQANRPAGSDVGYSPLQTAARLDTTTTSARFALDKGGALGEDHEHSDGTPSISEMDPDLPESDIKEAGLTFDDLVDRLLSPSMLKSDTKFVAVFLCLYRKFAAPAELMSAVLHRFEQVGNNNEPHLSQLASQLRYIEILAQWVTEYPGDFAYPLTYQCMTDFVTELANIRVFTVGAKEISSQLSLVSEDDDTQWACSDIGRGEADTMASLSGILLSSRPGTTTRQNMSQASAYGQKEIQNPGRVEDAKDRAIGHSRKPSSSSSTGHSDGQSGASSSTTHNSPVEVARRQAHLLTPTTRNSLSKFQWHQFMDISNDEIARELTRIDWIMFSSIRPRDLVRHVSLAGDRKEKCRQLENVNRMIDHFNHVAFWVANIVLLRDKSKHRAQALEKFMNLAWVSTG